MDGKQEMNKQVPETDWFFAYSSPQQGDLRLSGPPTGQGADGGARTRDRKEEGLRYKIGGQTSQSMNDRAKKRNHLSEFPNYVMNRKGIMYCH
ncbi:hypothetical protein PoB_003723500 [Plakobranchus ocellatus]|uniref:Uncharacterized protein n=1 Tax=Plakobranchus ocellatus TaxID=259542 RepID=A0AAV4ATT5_9GAST|nr:hypothetical protein PoB_003723500 [Plakobranchus ocellatus]